MPAACAASRTKLLSANTRGLPIPAYSEVAIEGEVIPGTKIPEGPFGEFTGYYAGGLRSEPMLKVKRLMYRNDPIITGAPPFKPAAGAENNLIRAAYIWNYLDKAGVPDVRGVAYYQTRMLVVVAIKQRYPGHARQAALIASQCRAAALLDALRRRGRRGHRHLGQQRAAVGALHAHRSGERHRHPADAAGAIPSIRSFRRASAAFSRAASSTPAGRTNG